MICEGFLVSKHVFVCSGASSGKHTLELATWVVSPNVVKTAVKFGRTAAGDPRICFEEHWFSGNPRVDVIVVIDATRMGGPRAPVTATCIQTPGVVTGPRCRGP